MTGPVEGAADAPDDATAGVVSGAAGWPGWLAPALIFGVALVLRLVYFGQISNVPFVEFPIVDARAYDEWAQRIVAEGWWGDEAFYQAPAYPYLLASVYSTIGRDLTTIHILQLIMGSVSCVFAFFGARALFGATTGLVAGLMLAIYPPAIFFDGIIGKASLGLFLLTGLLALLLRHQQRPSSRLCLIAGLGLGLLVLTRENALALVPAIPLWLWLRFRDTSARERGRWIVAFAIGAGALLLFVGVRNQIVGDTFALTTSQLGSNFYMGNSPEATGLYVPLIAGRHTPVFEASDAELLAERELGRELTRGEVSSYWLARGLAFVRNEPLRWLELCAGSS